MKYSLRDVTNELKHAFQQAIPDAKINEIQIAYWITVIGDRLKSQHLQKHPSKQFLNVFPDISIQTATNNSAGIVKSRKYIDLPSGIYNWDNDKGIDYVAYYNTNEGERDRPEFAYKQFQRTYQTEIPHLYSNRFETPSANNPYFYLADGRVYFLGIEESDVNVVEIGLYTSFDPVNEVDIDADFEFPQELYAILHRQVLDLGRFVLMMPQDRVNDGANELQGGLPDQKITSVNDLNQDER